MGDGARKENTVSCFGDYPYCGHRNTVSTEADFQESKKLSIVSDNNCSNYLQATNLCAHETENDIRVTTTVCMVGKTVLYEILLPLLIFYDKIITIRSSVLR